MTRDEILKNPAYWTQHIQLKLFETVLSYMDRNNLNRTQLAEKMGVSKSYISQLFNGNCDHKISKLVEMAIACDMVPDLRFRNIDQAEAVVRSSSDDDWTDCNYKADSLIHNASEVYTPEYITSFYKNSILTA